MFLHQRSHYADPASMRDCCTTSSNINTMIKAVAAYAITLHLPGEKGSTDEVVVATLFCTVIRGGL